MSSLDAPFLSVTLTRSVRDHIPEKVLRMLLGVRFSTTSATLELLPPSCITSGTTVVVCLTLGPVDGFAGMQRENSQAGLFSKRVQK